MDRNSTALTKEDLEFQKLLLEVAQLQQRWWKKPSYILAALPTVLAIGSLLAAYSTGYFQAVATKLDNQRHDLEIQVQQFNEKKTALQRENIELLRENQKLLAEKENLMREGEVRNSLYESTHKELELTQKLLQRQKEAINTKGGEGYKRPPIYTVDNGIDNSNLNRLWPSDYNSALSERVQSFV